ncbi:MAG: hypothetical protein KME38_22430 [Spirirestis rafaelensis WJT71-NPBG6]|nr:hypothetical protein [Spirirestis rafaelensis WJT71-NPBG6]
MIYFYGTPLQADARRLGQKKRSLSRNTNSGKRTIRIASSSTKYQAKSGTQSIERHFRCQAIYFQWQFLVGNCHI